LRRVEPGVLRRLHADPGTRVVLLHGDRFAVVDDGAALRLALVGPEALPTPVDPRPTPPPRPDAADDPADVEPDIPDLQEPPLWLYLGDHAGASYLALALPPTDEALVVLAGVRWPEGMTKATRDATAAADPSIAGAAMASESADATPRTDGAPVWAGLRRLDHLDDLEQGLATEAVALANWHAVHTFCPRCGAPTHVRSAGWVRWCPVEDRELYPRTDPAVIMTVVDDDDRLLLGHATHWPPGRYSTLAGFVEPGEALEQAVRREVFEEVGIEVGEVIYRGSQPWPFPASLMLGFRACVPGRGADARPDGVEMADARWFTREELHAATAGDEVRLPTRLSIARALIDEWYGGELPDTEFLG
jgi:NAD+ diphosphatase